MPCSNLAQSSCSKTLTSRPYSWASCCAVSAIVTGVTWLAGALTNSLAKITPEAIVWALAIADSCPAKPIKSTVSSLGSLDSGSDLKRLSSWRAKIIASVIAWATSEADSELGGKLIPKVFSFFAKRAIAAAALRQLSIVKSLVLPKPTKAILRTGFLPPTRLTALVPDLPSNSSSAINSEIVPVNFSSNWAKSPDNSVSPSEIPTASKSPVQSNNAVFVALICILF